MAAEESKPNTGSSEQEQSDLPEDAVWRWALIFPSSVQAGAFELLYKKSFASEVEAVTAVNAPGREFGFAAIIPISLRLRELTRHGVACIRYSPLLWNGHRYSDIDWTDTTTAWREQVTLLNGGYLWEERKSLIQPEAPFCDVCGHIVVWSSRQWKCVNCGNKMQLPVGGVSRQQSHR